MSELDKGIIDKFESVSNGNFFEKGMGFGKIPAYSFWVEEGMDTSSIVLMHLNFLKLQAENTFLKF